MTTETPRTVKLYCPSLSKVVQLVAWDEQRLDLGRIARTFGLDPSTLKLNGHFISRGVDLIASSVTWKSLISFFSARGLSTGASHSDALIVDGKLSKIGSKRGLEPTYVNNNGSFSMKERAASYANGRLEPEDSESVNTKRLKDGNSGVVDRMNQITAFSGMSLKRKLSSQDPSSLKRTRTNKCNLVPWRRNVDLPSIVQSTQLHCSFISENAKRTRENEMLVAAPCKRTR